MKTNNNIPAYRFKGYTDAWELRKLNEVSDIYDGTHQTPKYQDDGVMFLSVENIKTLTSNKFISREAFEVEFKIRPQRGDVLMTRIGDIGTANVVETDEDLAYYVSLALFKSEELNPYFLQASIYAPFVQDQIWKRTLHIAFPKKINKNEIGQVPINVPTLAEQTKIGSFFKQLDDTITLHQRKLDTLKEQKKTYLKLLFPAKGQTKPALRFQGFEDDWKEVKLGEVVSISSGYTGDATLNNGKYKLTRIETISEGKVDVSRTGFSNELPNEKYRLNFGDILFSNINSLVHIGKVAIFNTMEEVFHGINLLRLVPNKGLINPYFIYYQLVTESKRNWSKAHANQAVNQASINQTSLSTQKISLPTLPEQEAIGTFFQTLDQEMAQVEDKLASLKEMKKTLLRKLFV